MIISVICILVMIIVTCIIYANYAKFKKDINKQLNSIVDQINDSQYYEYNFDKQQDQNIMNVDKNISSLHSSLLTAQDNINYLKLITASDRKIGSCTKITDPSNIKCPGQNPVLNGVEFADSKLTATCCSLI